MKPSTILQQDAFEAAVVAALGLHRAGELQQAEQAYRELHQSNTKHVGVAYLLGSLLLQTGKSDEGLGLLSGVIDQIPDYVPALANIGLWYHEQGNHRQAVEYFEEALRYEQNDADLYRKAGIAAAFAKLGALSIERLFQALALNPALIEVVAIPLMNQLRDKGRCLEALKLAEAWVKNAENPARAVGNMQLCLGRSGMFDLVDEDWLASMDDGDDDQVLFLRAALAYPFSRERATELYRKAIAIKPDLAPAHFNLSLCLLGTGRLAEGWREFDWRFDPTAPVGPHTYTEPEWDGRPLDGAGILIHSEQGLGDVIQFLRYAPLIKQRGGRVIFGAYDDVLQLLKVQEDAETRTDVSDLDLSYSWQIPLLSLGRVFSPTEAEIPNQVPYLAADQGKAAYWARYFEQQPPGFRVGLVWAGNPNHINDHNRSAALEDFFPLAAVPGVLLYALQKGSSEQQVQMLHPAFRVETLSSQIRDFGDTAAIIANLDLVICVDTSVAHLAGAMAKPVWMLLPHHCDWRWIEGRDDTPWYPTMRLFRQAWGESWTDVMPHVANALASVVEQTGCAVAVRHALALRAALLDESKRGVAALPDFQDLSVSSEQEAAWLTALLLHSARADVSDCLRLLLPARWQAILAASGAVESSESMWQAIWSGSEPLSSDIALVAAEHLRRRDFSKAREVLSRDRHPESLTTTYVRAQLARMEEKYTDAVAGYRRVLAVAPRWSAAWGNLGLSLHHLGEDQAALEAFEQALMLRPKVERVWFFAGWFLYQTRRFTLAETVLRAGLNRFPGSRDIRHHLALTLYALGQDVQAAVLFEQLLADAVHDDELVYGHLLATERVRSPQDIREAYSRLMTQQGPIAQKARLAFGMWSARQGDWQAGLLHYEARLIESTDQLPRRYPQFAHLPRWKGVQDHRKPLLVYAEQGLGDTLQYVRWLPQCGERVSVVCQDGLGRLLSSSYPEFDWIERSDVGALPIDAACYVDMMSLPHLLGVTSVSPSRYPYLRAPVEAVQRLADEHVPWIDGRRVGICWAGNPVHANDHLRSVTLTDLLPLFDVPDICWCSIQAGAAVRQLGFLPPSVRWMNLVGYSTDMAMASAILDQLALLITVDTALAHLAGAMGKPVWLLLGAHSDWRWGENGVDTPWYPSMRIFRLGESSWSDLAKQVRTALTTWEEGV